MRTGILLALSCAGALTAFTAQAATYRFTYTGYFNTTEALNPEGGPVENFTGPTAFTLKARFSDENNLVTADAFPFPVPPGFVDGFVAYSPIEASMTIGGTRYRVAPFADDPTGGIAVTLFDATNFFEPGVFGAGFINNPVADGAGIVGDFDGASPGFDVDDIGTTTFTGYNGAGYLPGVCENPGGQPPCLVTPLSLFAPDGTAYDLTLSVRIEQVGDTGLVHTAQIEVIPLPASALLLVGGLGLLGATARRRA